MNKHKNLYALLIACFFMISCATPRSSDGTIDTCMLTKPPKESKIKDAGHLGGLLGYPKEIPNNYSGCRKIWLTNYDSSSIYELFAIIQFNKGLISKVELFDAENNQKEVCEFDKNKVLTKGPLNHCSSYEIFEEW